MLFDIIGEIQNDPLNGLVILGSLVFALVVAITVHEFSHALTAYLQGDPTARNLGRLSLNPLRHLDPLGTVLIFIAGIGWGKPTPVNPERLRVGAKTGMAVVSLAGPLSNILVATVAALPLRAGLFGGGLAGQSFSGDVGNIAAYAVSIFVLLNLLLAAFNLIPLVPLDGYKVALGVLPREAAYEFGKLERFGPTPLFLLIMLDFLFGVNILGRVIRAILDVLTSLVL